MPDRKQFDLTLLYVEDEGPAREEIVRLLRRRVKEVLVAENGAEGLELFRQRGPDLVVTDIRMPVLNGLGMAREIKALDSDAKIIVTTAHSDSAYLVEAIETGIDHYVIKPIEAERLFAAIAKSAEVIEFRRAARRHEEERERLIAELQQALASVKALRGLLPICCSCKKIKDDHGYWSQVEQYIADHSEAEFSHSLCPECARRLYPKYYKE